MEQKLLKRLLEEAAHPNCLWPQRNHIQRLLVRAAAGGDREVLSTDDREAGIRTVLESLYVDTVRNRPDLLPTLFPAFAVMCGDRTGTIVADVDWSLIGQAAAPVRGQTDERGFRYMGDVGPLESRTPSEAGWLEHLIQKFGEERVETREEGNIVQVWVLMHFAVLSSQFF